MRMLRATRYSQAVGCSTEPLSCTRRRSSTSWVRSSATSRLSTVVPGTRAAAGARQPARGRVRSQARWAWRSWRSRSSLAAAGRCRYPVAAAGGLVLGTAAAGVLLDGAALGGRAVRGREVPARARRHRPRSRQRRGGVALVDAARVAHDRFDDQPNRRLLAALALPDPVATVDPAVARAGFAAGVTGALDQLAGDVHAVDADRGGADEAELARVGLAGDQGLGDAHGHPGGIQRGAGPLDRVQQGGV